MRQVPNSNVVFFVFCVFLCPTRRCSFRSAGSRWTTTTAVAGAASTSSTIGVADGHRSASDTTQLISLSEIVSIYLKIGFKMEDCKLIDYDIVSFIPVIKHIDSAYI